MGLFRLLNCYAIIKYFFSGVRDHLWIARVRGYRDHIIEPLTYDSFRPSLLLLKKWKWKWKKWKVLNLTFDSPCFIKDFSRDPEEKDEEDGIVENDEDEFGKFSLNTF